MTSTNPEPRQPVSYSDTAGDTAVLWSQVLLAIAGSLQGVTVDQQQRSCQVSFPGTDRRLDAVPVLSEDDPPKRHFLPKVQREVPSGMWWSDKGIKTYFRMRNLNLHKDYLVHMVPAPQATERARTARTLEDMGQALQALRDEAGLSLQQLADKVAPLNLPGLSRSTIGRLCDGGSLPATPEALEAVVSACGVPEDDVPVWLAARERVRATQRRGRRPAIVPPDAAPGDMEADDPLEAVREPLPGNVAELEVAAPPADVTVNTSDTDDEVIGTVQITRRHLRTAIVVSTFAGLAAASSSAPGVRNTGAVILGIAATLAMIETVRANTAAFPAAA